MQTRLKTTVLPRWKNSYALIGSAKDSSQRILVLKKMSEERALVIPPLKSFSTKGLIKSATSETTEELYISSDKDLTSTFQGIVDIESVVYEYESLDQDRLDMVMCNVITKECNTEGNLALLIAFPAVVMSGGLTDGNKMFYIVMMWGLSVVFMKGHHAFSYYVGNHTFSHTKVFNNSSQIRKITME